MGMVEVLEVPYRPRKLQDVVLWPLGEKPERACCPRKIMPGFAESHSLTFIGSQSILCEAWGCRGLGAHQSGHHCQLLHDGAGQAFEGVHCVAVLRVQSLLWTCCHELFSRRSTRAWKQDQSLSTRFVESRFVPYFVPLIRYTYKP